MPKTMTAPPTTKPGDPVLKAIIYPETKKVGCVLLQAMVGGNSRVCHLFNDWEVGTMKGAKPMTATLEQWQWLADVWNKKRVKRARN